MSEPVTMVSTPVKLDYQYTPGIAASRFLRAINDGRLVGQRCPKCTKVYIPPRGACSMCGVPTDEEVELSGAGTITTFAVVQLPNPNLPSPYVTAWVLLDGADITSMFLIQEVDPAAVHIGMRVEPCWMGADELSPSLESIRYYRPSGEPDASNESIKDYL